MQIYSIHFYEMGLRKTILRHNFILWNIIPKKKEQKKNKRQENDSNDFEANFQPIHRNIE